MIVSMAKYHFLVYHQEQEKFLEELMQLGMVHVLPTGSVADDETEELATDIREGEAVIKRFEKTKRRRSHQLPAKGWDAFPILSESAQLQTELEELESSIAHYKKDIALLKPWGEIPTERLAAMREAGINSEFFSYPQRKFDESWAEQYALEVINRQNNYVYFMIFYPAEVEEFPVVPSPLPDDSLAALQERLESCQARKEIITDILNENANRYLPFLKGHLLIAKDNLRYRMVNQNLELWESHKLVVVEGWCPSTREHLLQTYLEKEKIAFIRDEGAEEETPPVLLKNSRFAKLFEPIGEMFSLPAYAELDLTAFFAPFFLLFFGFCLGDAGYGLVLFIGATIAKRTIRTNFKPFATILQLFGLSTIVLGFISGTLFGLELIKVEAFRSMRSLFLSQDQLFNAALVIGLVQILFGMGVQVYKKVIFEGWLSAISRIGWIIMLLSLLDIMLLKKLGMVSMMTVFAGTAMIVFFGSPKKGPLVSFGMGLADLYNITGVMGDLLSYIRLFALGVSSAILGLVVNSIALSAKGIPVVGFVIFILILVIGHTANLMLASLSAFVHPMRLTFVEFYKNTGFDGGGKKYDPFERKARKIYN